MAFGLECPVTRQPGPKISSVSMPLAIPHAKTMYDPSMSAHVIPDLTDSMQREHHLEALGDGIESSTHLHPPGQRQIQMTQVEPFLY